MIRRNPQDIPPLIRNMHDGVGLCENRGVYTKKDFKSPLCFISHTVISPGAEIGYHTHGNDEEVYVILNGRGLMTVDGETAEVRTGDILVNSPGGSHGLQNTSTEPLTVMVFMAKIPD